MESIKTPENVKLPLICVTPAGTISVILSFGVLVELTVDRMIRVVCHDKFALTSNSSGTASAILHAMGRIQQNGQEVQCYFTSSKGHKKMAVVGSSGVLFTMDHLTDAFLVSAAARKGTASLSLNSLNRGIKFPTLDHDFTTRLFYTGSMHGKNFMEACNSIVQRARYEERDGFLMVLVINGFLIRQRNDGSVEINCRPRLIQASPTEGTAQIRTTSVDMAIQGAEKAYVKCGSKRVHVSCSGIVVSDGTATTSMDHTGRIVSSS